MSAGLPPQAAGTAEDAGRSDIQGDDPRPEPPQPAPGAWTKLLRRLDAYERLTRLDKPIGTLLLLWPTLWALWIAADGAPRIAVLAIFILGTVLMRSAGCAINDWADRGFDAEVERTKKRPLATGEIRPWEALVVAAALAALAFLLILPLNALTKWLSIPAVLIAATYPFTKRFFAVPQAYLGVAFSFGIPMAFAAISNGMPPVAWLLFAGNFLWIVAYDTEYALADYPDDIRIGIRTSAIAFGRFAVVNVVICYALALALFAMVGRELQLGPAYYAGLIVATALGAYHVWLIRDRDRDLCFKAFLHNNWLGLAVFAGIVGDYAWRASAWPHAF